MRIAALLLAVTLSPTIVFAARPVSLAGTVTEPSHSTSFSVSTATAIPGATLSPGEYVIAVVEHLSDRVILQVTDNAGRVKPLFLGLTTSSLPPSTSAGPIAWPGKGSPALRGFSFSGAPPVEFVYPKAQAVALAKRTAEPVLAIDSSSDNLLLRHEELSRQDMQIVTLWTLTPTRVGIDAAKYQPPPAAASSQPAYLASATPPPSPPLPAHRSALNSPSAASAAGASPAHKPSITALPHTASDLPAVLLAAVLALLGSAALRIRRLRSNEV